MAEAPPTRSPETPVEGPWLTVVVGDREYPIWLGKVTARTALDLNNSTGMIWATVTSRIFQTGNEGFSFELIAALIWISRRQNGEPRLPFDDVADAFTFDTEFTVKFPDAAQATEDATDPEASSVS